MPIVPGFHSTTTPLLSITISCDVMLLSNHLYQASAKGAPSAKGVPSAMSQGCQTTCHVIALSSSRQSQACKSYMSIERQTWHDKEELWELHLQLLSMFVLCISREVIFQIKPAYPKAKPPTRQAPLRRAKPLFAPLQRLCQQSHARQTRHFLQFSCCFTCAILLRSPIALLLSSPSSLYL